MRHPARLALTSISLCAALIAAGLSNAGSAAADPLASAAGIYKLGVGVGTGSTGVPYATTSGVTGTLTARHAVGDPSPSHWSISDASGYGSAGYGVNIAASSAVDTAFLQGSTQWTTGPQVKLSDDFAARFAAVATTSDAVVGDRICRTGWSPLDGDGVEAHGTPNLIVPPDIAPSAGASVICGRVTFANSTQIWIGNSDRPDGAIVAVGDSGGAVWKVTDDNTFMFLGMISDAIGAAVATVNGSAAYGQALVQPAWAIDTDTSLNIHPLLHPDTTPFFSISTSTYHPTPGGGFTLQGSLRDSDGSPLVGKTVHILQGSTFTDIGTTTTDSNGNLTYPISSLTGSINYAFRWLGDSTHPASASRSIILSTMALTINTPVTSLTTGGDLHVSATLHDDKGHPAGGRLVSLYEYPLAGGTPTVVTSATTSADGSVNLTQPAVTASENYYVRFAGDPSTNGDPCGAAASGIYALTVH